MLDTMFLTEMSLGRGCGRVFLKHCLQEPIITSHCGKRPTIFLNMKSSPATMKRLITCLNTPYKWGAFHYTGPTGQRPLERVGTKSLRPDSLQIPQNFKGGGLM